MSITTFFSTLLAFLQVFSLTFGIIGLGEPVIDYGGEPYVQTEISEYLPLIKEGKSKYVIIKSAKASPFELKAAQELQMYLYKISGVKLPISDDTSRVLDTEIIVGQTTREGKSSYTIDRKALGAEGFYMFVKDKKLIIAGGGERGTYYGVYTFLEEQLGCRWFTDTLTVIPESDTVQINAELDDTQKPAFDFRYVGWCGSGEFKNKHKYNYYRGEEIGGSYYWAAFCHTLPQMVPDSLYQSNPEFFAYREDTQARTTNHVCLSNPQAQQIAIENARTMLQNAPAAANLFCVGQKDNQEYCECESCKALYEQYGSRSATMLIFTNTIAEALKDEFPDIKFNFLAYQYTRKPPQGLTCADNVVPLVCTIEACYVHPLTECGNEDGEANDNFEYKYSEHDTGCANDLRGWAAISKEIYFYDYTVNFLNTVQFYPNFHTFADNFKFLQSIGCTGLYESGSPGGSSKSGEFGELREYLILKLMWNPDCDVEYHMMDFMRAYYGEQAADYIKEYIDTATNKIAQTTHAFCFDWHYQAGLFTSAEIRGFDSLWDAAEASAQTEQQLANIKRSRLQLRYYKANLFIGEFSLYSEDRGKENEKLYDDLVANGVTNCSAFSGLPPKSEINFFLSRPIDWR